MKKLLFIGLLLFFSFANAQEYKNLSLTLKANIGKDLAIYIEPVENDRVLVSDYLMNSLIASGFKVLTEKNKANYVITMKVKHRSDTGCGGRVMKELTGQISDSQKNGEMVGTFSFNQGGFEGKCTEDIMKALVKKIIEESFKNK
jgi:hypothetical protein